MSSRIVGIVHWSSPKTAETHELVCTTRDLWRIFAAATLAVSVLTVAGATWSGHQRRMAEMTLENARHENRILRERQAALFDKAFELVSRLNAEGRRLGPSERQTMLAEAETACRAAQYSLEAIPAVDAPVDPPPPIRLNCNGLAQGIRYQPSTPVRTARVSAASLAAGLASGSSDGSLASYPAGIR